MIKFTHLLVDKNSSKLYFEVTSNENKKEFILENIPLDEKTNITLFLNCSYSYNIKIDDETKNTKLTISLSKDTSYFSGVIFLSKISYINHVLITPKTKSIIVSKLITNYTFSTFTPKKITFVDTIEDRFSQISPLSSISLDQIIMQETNPSIPIALARLSNTNTDNNENSYGNDYTIENDLPVTGCSKTSFFVDKIVDKYMAVNQVITPSIYTKAYTSLLLNSNNLHIQYKNAIYEIHFDNNIFIKNTYSTTIQNSRMFLVLHLYELPLQITKTNYQIDKTKNIYNLTYSYNISNTSLQNFKCTFVEPTIKNINEKYTLELDSSLRNNVKYDANFNIYCITLLLHLKKQTTKTIKIKYTYQIKNQSNGI